MGLSLEAEATNEPPTASLANRSSPPGMGPDTSDTGWASKAVAAQPAELSGSAYTTKAHDKNREISENLIHHIKYENYGFSN
jgi:hypothetical protein